jgi:c-di-GMP-binding flagellar brake protein YcgR
MALQTRRMVEGASKKEAQYFGAIESKGVLVGPMGPDGDKTELKEGEVCVVRGFTGQYEFSFLSKVLQTFEKPFVYALLAYPAQVDARQVRQSMRTRVSWPTTLQFGAQANSDAGAVLDVTLIDLSPQGAMVKAPSISANVGQDLKIAMAVSIDGAPVSLALLANICHSKKIASENDFYIGLAFKQLTPQDKLILNYLTSPTQG